MVGFGSACPGDYYERRHVDAAKLSDIAVNKTPTDSRVIIDTPPPLKPDLLPHPAACQSGYQVAQIYGSKMAICQSTTGAKFFQCNANQACNVANNWHVCLASEFVARGGENTSSTIVAWIEGCLANGGSVSSSPSSTFCSCTQASGISSRIIGYDCTDNTKTSTSTAPYLGLVTNAQCWKLGSNLSASKAGYWSATEALAMLSAAVCCSN